MTKQQQDKLLEEAKLRYPPSTVFKSVNSSIEHTSNGNIQIHNLKPFEIKVDVAHKYYFTSSIYKEENIWAEIISKPEIKPSKDKPFYVVITEENKEVLGKWLDNCRFTIGDAVGLYNWGGFELTKEYSSSESISFGNEITFEQFLELYPEYKEDKPKFEVGKWYKRDTGSIAKLKEIKNGLFKCSEYIDKNGKLYGAHDLGYITDYGNTNELLTDLSEIQQYLPDGHVDKVTIIPEYVECIKIDTYLEIGKIYKVDKSKGFKYKNEKSPVYYFIDVNQGSPYYQSSFKPSTKEAYDKQFEPNKVEEEWVPKVGEWAVVERLDLCSLGKNNYKLFEVFQIYDIQKSSHHKYKYWLLKARGKEISSASCRKALPHEIPNYSSGIDPIKSDEIISILNHECKVNIDRNHSFNTFEQSSHLLPEMIKKDERFLSNLEDEAKDYVYNLLLLSESKNKQSLKTELELIPIKKLKTFNN